MNLNENGSNLAESFKIIIKSISTAFVLLLKEFNIYEKNDELLEDFVLCSIKNDDIPSQINKKYKESFALTENGNDIFVRIRFFAGNQYFIHDSIIECIIEKSKELSNVTNIPNIISDDSIKAISENINRDLKKKVGKISRDKFSLLKKISNLKYESKKCNGTIIFNLNSNKKDDLLIDFSSIHPDRQILFDINNLKLIRKLLEVTNDKIALYIKLDDIGQLYVDGFIGIYSNKNTIFSLLGPDHIKIEENGILMAEYLDGKFFYHAKYNFPEDDINKFNNCFSDTRICSKERKVQVLQDYINDIWENKSTFHGALIVFTDDTEFIKRMKLNLRAIELDNKNNLNLFDAYLSENSIVIELLTKLCVIDDALVFTTDGKLKLFGTILDGLSKNPGRRERGSRYNSTKTFVEYYSNKRKTHKYLGIVMSEDGPVDVLVG